MLHQAGDRSVMRYFKNKYILTKSEAGEDHLQRRRLHASFNKEEINLWQGDKPNALLNDQGRRLRVLSPAIATGSRQEPEPGLRLLNESSMALTYLSAGQGVWDGALWSV